MGATEAEQAEAMKRYIREIFIPEYAKNFNKGLSAEDIKFYGKIHFNRDRSDNELNMHCHLIVSRKDQSNKVKISPLTNHRNTNKGVIKGGFDRSWLPSRLEAEARRITGSAGINSTVRSLMRRIKILKKRIVICKIIRNFVASYLRKCSAKRRNTHGCQTVTSAAGKYRLQPFIQMVISQR